jgi:hypothetical protein
VNVLYEFRLGNVEEIVVAFEVRRMVLEGTSISRFIQLETLDHRAHGAIQNRNPASKEFVHMHAPSDFSLDTVITAQTVIPAR